MSTTTANYSVGVGAGLNNTQSILAKFHVANEALFSSTGMVGGPGLGAGSLSIAGSGSNVGLSIWKRGLTTLTDASGNRWMLNNPDGSLRFTTGSVDYLTVISTNGGGVGIGTTNPQNKLDVKGTAVIGSTYGGTNTAPANGLLVEGNVGVGTTTPQNKMDVKGAMVIGSTYGGTNAAPASGLLVEGNVGIGTTSLGTAKLAVEGKINTREIIVTATGTPFPDYVFSDDYKVMPLNELEQSIKQNKHLPNIPSASEIKEQGMNLGDMQVKLLQKIEELTLYMIDLKKENENLKTTVDALTRK